MKLEFEQFVSQYGRVVACTGGGSGITAIIERA
jgi:hypothetical protein